LRNTAIYCTARRFITVTTEASHWTLSWTRIAQSIWLRYGLDDRGSIPSRAGILSLRHCNQTGSTTHPSSYPVGTGGSLPGGKVTDVPVLQLSTTPLRRIGEWRYSTTHSLTSLILLGIERRSFSP
jgi:hypothetical protein